MKPIHLISLLLIPILAAPLTAEDAPSGKPEDIGMSSERLRRIHEAIQRHIGRAGFQHSQHRDDHVRGSAAYGQGVTGILGGKSLAMSDIHDSHS